MEVGQRLIYKYRGHEIHISLDPVKDKYTGIEFIAVTTWFKNGFTWFSMPGVGMYNYEDVVRRDLIRAKAEIDQKFFAPRFAAWVCHKFLLPFSYCLN